jgi:hypothetical protein
MTTKKKLTPVELDRLYLVYKLLIEAGQRQTAGSQAGEPDVPAGPGGKTETQEPIKKGRKHGEK